MTTVVSHDREWMCRAFALAKRARPEPGRWRPAPAVGAVLIHDGELVAQAYRGDDGRHAEFRLLDQLTGRDLAGATLYTTLEPCSVRNPPKRPCALRLLDRSIGTVVVGIDDPNPDICRAGRALLSRGGVHVRDFFPDLQEEIRADNAH